MKKNYAFVLLAFLALSYAVHSQSNPRECAETRIKESMEAFGGRNLLDSLKSLKLTGKGYRLMREQSERPEGPYITDYFDLEEVRDISEKRLILSKEFDVFDYSLQYLVNDNITARSFNNNDQWYPAEKSLESELALAPEQILETALKAENLHCEKDSIIQSIPHSVISFTWKNTPVKVYINNISHLITAVSTYGEYPFNNYHIWGDVSKTVYYSVYGLEENGLRYPYQQDIYINGELSENIMLTSLEQNIQLPDSLDIPEDTKQKLIKYDENRPKKLPLADKALEVEKDIRIVLGSWFTAIVKQDDGLVIIEAPISSEFGQGIIDMAHSLYPEEPIKAVVSSSPAWPHIGGLRPFAAQGIPIYHSNLNKGLLQELLKADFKTHPDKQQSLNRELISKSVSKKTIVGKGKNRMEIYPMNTEGSEGMLMVYFPEYELLYTSDLVQGINNPTPPVYFREYWKEALETISRENLKVKKIYGMHQMPVEISELRKALTQEKTQA